MARHPSIVDRLKRIVGIKSDDEIAREVRQEPHVDRAIRVLDRNARIIDELEALERRDRKQGRHH